MKEQAISVEPPIHILRHHPLVSQIIERTLALSGHPFSAAQIQRLSKAFLAKSGFLHLANKFRRV